MKKAARDEAKKLFFEAKGALSNKQVADRVGVNPLTVGRWKKRHNWEEDLRAELEASKATTGIRKREQRDQALALFLASGGSVKNRELALQVKVSPATIGSWKALEDWDSLIIGTDEESNEADELEPLDAPEALAETILEANEAVEALEEEVEDEEDAAVEIGPGPSVAETVCAPDADMAQLAAPEHIVLINERIHGLLQRDYLTPSEVADLASAKREALEAVEIYMAIAGQLGSLKK
jgi:hypothetical protein